MNPQNSSIQLDDADDIEGDLSFGDSDGNAFTNDNPEAYRTKEPSENDVLCGRGGSINSHPGNERFRLLVEKRKRVYLTARFKREKRLIANSIVSEIRALKPSGRFLARDSKSGLWIDIGDEKARDKTSQALRENAPSIRAEIETEINEQRAEMQREDQQTTSTPAPGPVHPFFNAGWFYPYYYGPVPPPLPHGHLHPPPPPPVHPFHNLASGHPPHFDPYYQGYGTVPDPVLKPPMTKSAIEVGTKSLKNWTKSSLSSGVGGASTTVSNEGSKSVASKPISYKHDDGAKKRRMVKFRDDDSQNTINRPRRVRPCYSPVNASDSIVDQLEDEDDMEPHGLDAINHDDSIMGQVAHYLIPTIGSWDVVNLVCGHDMSDTIPFPRSSASKNSLADVEHDEDEAIEWEGQEVQLVDESRSAAREYDRETHQRHPVESKNDNNSSVAFSSLGSCHSWIPEQFGSAASYFSYNRGGDDASGGGLSSIDMDYSAGGSLGGNSLSRVFENELLEGESIPSTPNMNHHILSRVPSWERNLRSKSPLSPGANDDESLISRTSSTCRFEDEPLSPINFLAGELAVIKRIEEEDFSWVKE